MSANNYISIGGDYSVVIRDADTGWPSEYSRKDCASLEEAVKYASTLDDGTVEYGISLEPDNRHPYEDAQSELGRDGSE